MAAYVIGPFIAVWIVIQLFVPRAALDTASGLAVGGWVCYFILLYANTKAQAAGIIPFPQSHWFFPDGQQISYDLFVPPEGWEEIGQYDDGSRLYRVRFQDRNAFEEADRPYPDVFDRALWKLPADWNHTFKRNGHGEFFYKQLFVDHPACENIEVSVVGWEEMGGTRLPICVITGCSYFFSEAAASGGKSFPVDKRELTMLNALQAQLKSHKETIRELTDRNEYLESENEQYATKEPENISKMVDTRINAFFIRHKTIMNAGKKSLLLRILNGKTLGIILLAIVAILLFMHYTGGWP